MAMNLGRGGVQNWGSDSSQLLQTGAIFRQQAEQTAKAEAAFELQSMREEADAAGWSMKRMAEMQPDRFKAASTVMFGGGARGTEAAENMFQQVLGGPETSDQAGKFLEDKEAQRFANLRYSNVGQNSPQQNESAPSSEGGQKSTQDSSTGGNGPAITRDDRGRAFVAADETGEKRAAYVKEIEAQLKADPNNKALAERYTDLMNPDNTDADFNYKLMDIVDDMQNMSLPWTSQGEREYTAAESSEALTAEIDRMRENSELVTSNLHEKYKNNPAIGQYLDKALSEVPPELQDDVNKWLIDNTVTQGTEANKEVLSRKINGVPVDRYLYKLAGSPGINGGAFTDPKRWIIDLPEEGKGGTTLWEQPRPTFEYNVPEPQAPKEEEAPTPTPTAPLPKAEKGIETWLDYKKASEDTSRESGALTTYRAGEIRNAEEQVAETNRKIATTGLINAQETSTYGNLELAYNAASQAVNTSADKYGKEVTDAAKIFNDQFFGKLSEAGISTPPPNTIGNAENFTKWFDELRPKQQRDYVDATQSMASAIYGNPALSAAWKVVPVTYKSGLFNWGSKNASVIVPQNYVPNQSNTSIEALTEALKVLNLD